MKTALASVIRASESPLSDWNRITKTSAVLRKLSLNAAKNWHQNSGANRLDSSRGDGMPPHYCKVPRAPLPEKIRRPYGRPIEFGTNPQLRSEHFPRAIGESSQQERSTPRCQ